MSLLIKTLKENELENIRQLLLQIFGENRFTMRTILEKYQKYPSLFIGCFDREGLVGAVFGWPDTKILVVKAIAVVESHRRKGIGTALLRAFEKAAAAEGFESFVLGGQWEAVPFYLHYDLNCFANVQITPDSFPWNTIKELRLKYNVISAVVFGPSIPSNFISRLDQELKVKVTPVKSDFESISIQTSPQKISKEVLEVMKRDFNAYSTQFAFKKKLNAYPT